MIRRDINYVVATIMGICLFSQLASAASGAENAALIAKADSLLAKAESLLKLSEQNVSWGQNLMQLNSVFVGIIALAFISIVVYIIKQLAELHKEQRINGEKIKLINDMALNIEKINSDVEKVKAEMRDATLANRDKKISDDDIAKIVKETKNVTPTVEWVNFLKNLMWKENVGLEQIRPVLEDVNLHSEIQEAYKNTFINSFLSQQKVIDWAYQIKVKKVPIQGLLAAEQEQRMLYKQMIGSVSLYSAAQARKRFLKSMDETGASGATGPTGENGDADD